MTTNANQYQRIFIRKPDQRYSTFDDLYTETLREKDHSEIRWTPPANMYVTLHQDRLKLKVTGDRAYELTDWSFSQLCNYVDADRKIIERLQLATASQVLSEIFPFGDRPLQLFTTDTTARSIHRISYERLFNADVLDVVIDEAMHLTGKYNEVSKSMAFFASDRDMHAYIVDESAWTHYWDEKFAPAFVVWNSEVGARSVGIRAGWYHAGSNGFILHGDPCPVSYSRRHSLGVKNALSRIRERIQVWLATAESHSDLLMKHLASARSEPFASTNAVMKRRLTDLGLSSEQAKAIDKWLISAGRSFSRLDVAIAISAVSSTLPFASTRIEMGQIGGLILHQGVDATTAIALQRA